MNSHGKFLRYCAKIIIFLFKINLVCTVFIVIITTLHWSFSICPIFFQRFEETIPVVYGLPTYHAIEQAKRGEIILGGCVVRPTRGCCPYCKWPAE